MEALILVLFALAVIVLLDGSYWIAISLARWSPIVAIGALIGWFAHHVGAAPREAIGLAILACLIARHVLRLR